MVFIKRYTSDQAEQWNRFNREAKNPLFMFDRNFMEYHSDRFTDHSLMFYRDDELIALLPMNEKDGVLYSHGGLTYGGFITNTKMKQHLMNECFSELIHYAKENHFGQIIYKPIPHTYHLQPAEEDIYALYINHAELMKIEASTVIDLQRPIKMPKGRKAQISRAKREGVEIQECTEEADFRTFIDLENSVLSEHHNTKAVHTGDELYLLHTRFPENVRLFAAMKDAEMIAGTVIFEYQECVHTQYMAANDTAREIGALDLAVKTVIDRYSDKKWLDFGISTEDGGQILNEGLISQKEGFGGRTEIYTGWRLNLSDSR